MTSRGTGTSATFADWVFEVVRGSIIAAALARVIAAGLRYVLLEEFEQRSLVEYLKAAAWTSFEPGSVAELGPRG